MTPEEELRRAGEAQQLLDNALFQQARSKIYSDLATARSRVATTDLQAVADLVRVEQVAAQFFGFFELIAQTGKIASLDVERERARSKSFLNSLNVFRTLGRNAL